MKPRKNVTILVSNRFFYAFDPDADNTFFAICECSLIDLFPIATYTENQCKANNTEYRRGYLMGMSDGYHKGYADAMAYEELNNTRTEDTIIPRCARLCKACPHYDDLFDTCKFYS